MVKNSSGGSSHPCAVIYARYSSHNQRDVSIEQQVNACRKYAEENDLEVIRIYDDHAMTGTNDNRPEFRQMIADSASGAFRYVIVYTLDRFSRDRYDAVTHKHTLKEHGVRVLSAMENIQDNPTGALMESILEGFADYYSKELSQKIRRGMTSNAEKCLVNGPLPLGYRRGSDGHYEIAPGEAAVVQELFTRVAAGEAFKDIFTDFNNRGITTKTGKPWTRVSASKLLGNENYIGVYTHCGVRIEGGVPAILDRSLFDQVQDYCLFKRNPRGNPQKRKRDNSVYLLTGKLFCGHCKSPMVGVSGTGAHGELHYYYACKAHRYDRSCKKKQVTRAFAERLVAGQIRQLISQPEVISWIADAAVDYFKSNRESDEILLLKDRLAAVQKEKNNVFSAIRRGMIDDEIQALYNQLKADESSIRAKLALAESRTQKAFTREHILAWLESFASGDVEDKSYQETLFDAFLVRAYLYDDHLKLVLNYTGSGTSEIEIPFDIDAIGQEDSQAPSLESSYKRFPWPPYTRNPNLKPVGKGFGFLVFDLKEYIGDMT